MQRHLSWLFGFLVAMQSLIAVAGEHATGLVFPKGWKEAAAWDGGASDLEALPTRWNWNDYGSLSPIRSQGQCGSCWAFATTGVTESLQRLVHPETTRALDLAEQTLVSTCERSGDCNGGFFTAFDYIRDRGLPLESADPYRGVNSACKPGLVAAAHVSRWAYVGDGRTAPSLAQLKQAVYDHGPIAVAMNGSLNYRSGIFTACASASLNHMVVIEGWQDDPTLARNGGGYWLVRNSWGTNWGERGYLKIAYRSTAGSACNGIGNVAAYATVDGIENLRDYLGLPSH